RSVRSFFGGLAARRVAQMPVAEPEPESEPATEPQPEPHAEAAAPAIEAAYESEAYSDEAFSEDSYGASAFTSGFKPRASNSFVQAEDYGGESLVSRVEEETDAFGMAISREREHAPEATQSPVAPPEPEAGSVDELFEGTPVPATDDAAAS